MKIHICFSLSVHQRYKPKTKKEESWRNTFIYVYVIISPALKSAGLTHLLIVFKNHIPFIQSINIQWTPAVSGHCNLSLLLKESNGTLFSGLKAAISTCQFMLECWCQFQGNLFHIGGKKEGHDKEGNGGRCSAPTKHQAKNSAAVWCSLM